MDDLPKELKFLVLDYFDLDNLYNNEWHEWYGYSDILLESYTPIKCDVIFETHINFLENINKKRLRKLTYDGYYDPNVRDIIQISDKFINLKSLECLNCMKIKNIPSNLINLTSLTCNSCYQLQEISVNFTILTSLDIGDCIQLKEIPNTLIYLTELYCCNCIQLKEIPKEFINLTILDCTGNEQLQEIPTEFVNIKELHVSGCKQIRKIPQELANLTLLQCFGFRVHIREIPIENSIKKLYANDRMLTFFNLFVMLSR